MGVASWTLWALLTAAALGLSVVHYRRRETPGRGRIALAALRAGSICLLLLLLFDPELPARGGGIGRGAQVLLDASLSMSLPVEPGGPSRWQQALQVARSRGGGTILLFGDRARAIDPDSLPAGAPGDGRSRVLPALQAAAESGARRVVLITDGAIEDADQVARWAVRLGVEIEPVRIGGAIPNRTLAEVAAPAWIESGQPAMVDFGVAGTSGDSAMIIARREGRVVGRAATGPAGPGRLATGRLELRLEPPPGGGWVRLELALEQEDAVPDDDVRTVYIHVSDEPAGVALVSFRPDWEPRFLAPVLQQALGLPLHAWLRSASGQYTRLGGGLDAGAPATEADVRRALGRAELVVLHGVGVTSPAWAIEVLTQARRLLVFPADERVALPATIGPEAPGDFYLAPIVPPSPVAALLAGLELSGVAPLASLRPVDMPAGSWTPLLATRGRQGTPQPIAVAADESGRRWVVALGTGYWSWAFRGGAERQVYERLWGALAGWLTRERGTATLAAVRPARLAWPRATPVPWVAPGLAVDSLQIRVTSEAGDVVQDTVLAPTGIDTAFASAPQPGHYGYRARAFSGDTIAEATGEFSIERYSPELSRPAAAIAALSSATTLVRSDDDARRLGTPLHATIYPYVVLLTLLAVEWILRRRWGLR